MKEKKTEENVLQFFSIFSKDILFILDLKLYVVLGFSKYIIWEEEYCTAYRLPFPFVSSKSFVSQTNFFQNRFMDKPFQVIFQFVYTIYHFPKIPRNVKVNDKVSYYNYNLKHFLVSEWQCKTLDRLLFWAIRPKFGNCAFPQNFHTRK